MWDRLRQTTRHALARIDAALLRRLPAGQSRRLLPPPTVLLMIYRRRNAALARKLADEAKALGMRVALWGLDGAAPDLRDDTCGTGPGTRNELLNRLFACAAPTPAEFILISDDDFYFAAGGLGDFMAVSQRGGFMLSQPTHSQDSYCCFGISRGRPHLLARTTLFIEVGPMVLVHPEFRARLFPLHPELEMGWAESLYWHAARAPGEVFGLIDAVRIRHVGQVGRDYDSAREQRHLDATLRHFNLASIHQIAIATARWYRWQHVPPWVQARQAPVAARLLLHRH